MIVYVKAEVSIHGLEERTLAEVVTKIHDAIAIDLWNPSHADIKVKVIEHAGTEEPR